jgi:hypothetical protein
MGSKTKIAVDILRQLPQGNRFVDLFGGGFAMTHAAILTGRYYHFYYNEYNKLVVDLINEALDGKYNYAVFKPEFITREKFHELKDKSGYVACIWSFGNNPGEQYMFGKDVEPMKHAAHDFVVFNKWSKELEAIDPKLKNVVKSRNISKRRIEFCGYCRQIKKRFDLQQLEQLERLQQLEQLERLQQLERLERLEQTIVTNCGSYDDYEFQEGDVVYCDPPYEATAEYKGGFDTQAFYDWVYSRPYQVWFSSYKISDKRFKMVWAKRLRTSLGQGNQAVNFECLYTNKG